MGIKCCKDCVAPKRHPGCHGTCEEYKKEKAILDTQNKKIREEKDKDRACKSQYNKILCKSAREYRDKKRKRNW